MTPLNLRACDHSRRSASKLRLRSRASVALASSFAWFVGARRASEPRTERSAAGAGGLNAPLVPSAGSGGWRSQTAARAELPRAMPPSPEPRLALAREALSSPQRAAAARVLRTWLVRVPERAGRQRARAAPPVVLARHRCLRRFAIPPRRCQSCGQPSGYTASKVTLPTVRRPCSVSTCSTRSAAVQRLRKHCLWC